MQKKIKLTYLKKATKFLSKNQNTLTEQQVDALVISFVKKKFYNIDININYKQMKGSIANIYRIRKGNFRILVSVTDDEIIIEAIIEDIDFRGNIYKNL
jgi:mRNA interferase RelE/StbE